MDLRWVFWAGAGCLLLLGGCRAGPFARAAAEERLFEAEPEVVFAEARALLEARGYRIHQAKPASGRIEALSPLRMETGFRQTFQRRIQVVVVEEGPDQSRVFVTATLLEEADTPVQGASTFERPLPDAFFYEDLFEQLGQRLGQ